jgi:zinc/manganese transport system substrate-binding protein
MLRFIFLSFICMGSSLSVLQAKEKLIIVTSFSILKDVTQRITQEKAVVISIVGANQDTHVFEPTPMTNKLLLQADLILISGFNFERWMERLSKISGKGQSIIVASQGVQPLSLENTQHKKRVPDPHVWNAVGNVKIWVHNILQALVKLDPVHRPLYEKNARAYLAELTQLEDWIQEQFKDIPIPLRKVITAHDAFGYYGKAYGVNFLAPMGLSTEAEPSASAVAHLIKQIQQEKVTTLFVENIANERVIKQISSETGIKIGGTLYSDALSLPEGPAGSYVKLMRHNTTLLRNALKSTIQCQ